WLVTGIAPQTRSLARGAAMPAGAMAAKNDKGNAGYAGPCPPSGRHHYHFHVYALDIKPGKAMSKQAFLSAIDGHVLADGELVGRRRARRLPGRSSRRAVVGVGPAQRDRAGAARISLAVPGRSLAAARRSRAGVGGRNDLRRRRGHADDRGRGRDRVGRWRWA